MLFFLVFFKHTCFFFSFCHTLGMLAEKMGKMTRKGVDPINLTCKSGTKRESDPHRAD